MEKARQKAAVVEAATIDVIGEDLLHNILCRLPAVGCASAACVSRSWNHIINRLLALPNLSSALSRNSSLQDAVNEVIDKVLAKPIRPQFVIASVGPSFDLQEAHRLITIRFDSQVPVITSISQGVFGQHATTNEFEEVQWDTFEDDEGHPDDLIEMSEACPDLDNGNQGVLLTVGFLPGLAVDLIPLSKTPGGVLMVDKFVLSIREHSSSLSGSASPMGILLFSDQGTDITPALKKLDYASSPDTVVVGGGGSQFLYRGERKTVNPSSSKASSSAAVALLFTRDRGKPPGVGKTQLHAWSSAGISQIGPTYKALCVRERPKDYSTWLTAKRGGVGENLDGEAILDQIYDELGGHIHCPTLYIGVTKKRKCSIGKEKPSWICMLEFHEVLRGDEEYLYVHGVGIKSGDPFQFYLANSDSARVSVRNVSNNFRLMKQDLNYPSDAHKKFVFGGMMFACCGRGKLFFGEPNVDGSPFLENFPGVTLAGTYCAGEIARGNLYKQETQEHRSVRCCLHVYSTVYLVMSYTPALESW